MDKEWLKYWEKIQDIDIEEEKEITEEEKKNKKDLEEAQDLYKTVLDD